MASVGEVKAAAGGMKDRMDEARGMMEAAHNIVTAVSAEAAHVLGDSAQETAQAVIARCHGAEGNLDDALANSGLVVEALEQFIGSA